MYVCEFTESGELLMNLPPQSGVVHLPVVPGANVRTDIGLAHAGTRCSWL
jgi:hypothetical protein